MTKKLAFSKTGLDQALDQPAAPSVKNLFLISFVSSPCLTQCAKYAACMAAWIDKACRCRPAGKCRDAQPFSILLSGIEYHAEHVVC